MDLFIFDTRFQKMSFANAEIVLAGFTVVLLAALHAAWTFFNEVDDGTMDAATEAHLAESVKVEL